MKSILKGLIIAVILIVTKNSFADDVSFSKGSYQEMLDLAKQQNKIVMIDFITDWCKWCVETDRKVYTNPEVAAYANEHQINWKIDAEKGEGPELAKKYSVKGYPTIVFTSADGTEIDRIYGYLPAPQFLQRMKDYNNGINTLSAIQKMLAANSEDAVANYLMADKISSNGVEGDAKVYLQKTISNDPSNEKGYTDDAKFMLAYLNQDPVALKAAIAEYPESEKVKEGYLNLASYYAEKSDFENADLYFQTAFDKYGKNDFDLMQTYGGYLLNRGYIVMKDSLATDKQRQEAIVKLTECIEYVSGTVNEASANYIMSELYFQMANLDKANEHIDRAIVIYDKKAYRDQKEKINKQQATK